jgi:hypothetical protein
MNKKIISWQLTVSFIFWFLKSNRNLTPLFGLPLSPHRQVLAGPEACEWLCPHSWWLSGAQRNLISGIFQLMRWWGGNHTVLNGCRWTFAPGSWGEHRDPNKVHLAFCSTLFIPHFAAWLVWRRTPISGVAFNTIHRLTDRSRPVGTVLSVILCVEGCFVWRIIGHVR